MVFRPARLLPFALAAVMAACSHVPHFGTGSPSSRYYKDDGPGDRIPANLDSIPDATPRREALNRFANRPYTVLGRDYVPATELKPYRERGVASWYGRKFHGQKTALGETYDMYAMTAAHPTLPLPSYARVTNLASGKSVVVRVNDRGPFLHDRIIDLSYAAAQRIGVAQQGSGEVIVEAVLPGDAVLAAPLPPVGDVPPQTMVKPAAPAIIAGDGTPPTQAGAGRFMVQLGAFRDNGNAQNFLARIREQVAGIAGDARVSQIDGLWRVYVGPYDNQAEARRISDRLYASLGIDNTVAEH
ncbi:MAG: septal ring lytic transglycosylase RlpA family protein [Casimicrobiaceae bacterium]